MENNFNDITKLSLPKIITYIINILYIIVGIWKILFTSRCFIIIVIVHLRKINIYQLPRKNLGGAKTKYFYESPFVYGFFFAVDIPFIRNLFSIYQLIN